MKLGLARVIFLTVGVIATVLLFFIFQFLGLLIGASLLGTIFLFTGRRKQANIQKPMSLRRFVSLLEIVALVAVLFSPSTLHFSSGQSPPSDTFNSILPFVNFLQSRFHVIIFNSSMSLAQVINQGSREAYFLIGPDQGLSVAGSDLQLIQSHYKDGSLSMLVAEGNTTNNSLLNSLFHVQVKGDAIEDYSSPFVEQRVFPITAHLASGDAKGFVDVASPIVLGKPSGMTVIASSSTNSTETGYLLPTGLNTTLGPRHVIAIGESNGARSLLITDSGPFSTNFGKTIPQLGLNETSFAESLVNWVTGGDRSTTIILDNSHYTPSVANLTPNLPFNVPFNLPVGRLVTLALTFMLSTTNDVYAGFLNVAKPFLLGLALLTAWSMYGTMITRYATERRGKDDEPLPRIEKSIVAESQERRSFLQTSRSKGFFVASLEQLHEVLDSIALQEFGTNISSVSLEQLSAKFGLQYAEGAVQLFARLSKIARYAKGEKRFLFPPVLRWKSTSAKLTKQAEEFLNQLGLTMAGESGEKKQLEYKLRRG